MSDDSPTPAPHRRWLRFSLRTVMVAVAILGVWLGYHLHWISERREARAWLDMNLDVGGSIGFKPKPSSAFPWALRLLGEKPEPLILMRHARTDLYRGHFPIPEEYVALVRRVESLFPEAIVKDLTIRQPHSGDEGQQRKDAR